MNRDQNQNNPDNKATNPNPPTSLNRIAAELEKLNSHTQKQAADEEKENKLWYWRNSKKDILFIVQVITLFGTMVALIFTCNSVNMSRNALERADTANAVAKRSLDSTMNFNRKSMEYQRSKDVSNDSITNNTLKIAQQNADAATDLANQSINSLKQQQKLFEIENEPFIQISSIKFGEVIEGRPLTIEYQVENIKHIPVYLKSRKFKILSFRETEWEDVKNEKESATNFYLVKETALDGNIVLPDEKLTKEFVSSYLRGTTDLSCSIYLSIYYINIINKKQRVYNFSARLRQKNFSRVEQKIMKNENKDVN